MVAESRCAKLTESGYDIGEPCRLVLQKEMEFLVKGCEDEQNFVDKDGKFDTSKMKSLLVSLDQVSQIKCDSIMFELNYGGSPYGQFLAATIDIMHALEHGVIPIICKCYNGLLDEDLRRFVNEMHQAIINSHFSTQRSTYPETHYGKGITESPGSA